VICNFAVPEIFILVKDEAVKVASIAFPPPIESIFTVAEFDKISNVAP